jgi:hypothetical protein
MFTCRLKSNGHCRIGKQTLEVWRCNIKLKLFVTYLLFVILFLNLPEINVSSSVMRCFGLERFWKASSRSAGQQIPRLSSNIKVHYRVYRSPPLDPVLGQMSSVHTITPYFFKICAFQNYIFRCNKLQKRRYIFAAFSCFFLVDPLNMARHSSLHVLLDAVHFSQEPW